MSIKRAVAYARYSTDMQREESIDAQIRAVNKYAAEEGIIMLDYYIDEAYSARTTNRPAFQKMMADATLGTFDYVIVHKLDRFSRDRHDIAVSQKHLFEHNVKLISVIERFDDSPESILMESFVGGLAEYQSRNISREVKKGLHENALKAQFNGGTISFGFDVDENKNFIINEHEAIAIRHIFNAYTSGHALKEISEWLEENNYKTRQGNNFAKSSLLSILQNPKYYGLYEYGLTRKKHFSGTVKRVKGKEEDVVRVENGLPAIIEKKLFERAGEIREMNKNRQPPKEEHAFYILSGITYCDECGSLMSGSTSTSSTGKKYNYYRCLNNQPDKNCTQKQISKKILEYSVIDYLQKDYITFNERRESFEHLLRMRHCRNISDYKNFDISRDRLDDFKDLRDKLNTCLNKIETKCK